jgi:hypothetical protein
VIKKSKNKSFKKYYDDFEDDIEIKEEYKRIKINKNDIPLLIENEEIDEDSD